MELCLSYNGKPEEDKIIHTFFQIDVGKLEVYQQEELQQGIQIISKDQFNSLMKEYRNTRYHLIIDGSNRLFLCFQLCKEG